MNTKNLTVKNLRKDLSMKVRVNHKRRLQDGRTLSIFEIRQNKLQNQILACGGETTVEVTDANQVLRVASARCSENDNYCRKTALNICLGRLNLADMAIDDAVATD